jgi:GNAT superfamily N-acetyltransferase
MIRELLPPETRLAHAAIRELRPRFADSAGFVHQVDEVQRPAGYRLAGAFEPGREEALAVAGFRAGENLAWGRFLYVDDLSTHPDGRRKGHGRALLDWLAAEAVRLGCAQLHLDSGVGPERVDAHRLYFNAGLRITSHHFARGLPGRA